METYSIFKEKQMRQMRNDAREYFYGTLILLLVGIIALTIFDHGFQSRMDQLLEQPTLTITHAEAPKVEEVKPVKAVPIAPKATVKPQSAAVTASWYDYSLKGIVYSKDHRTAASRDYPRGTMLRVCRADNSAKCVDVLVNDYGPQAWTGKSIDLSSFAFSQLEILSKGVVKVTITKL